MEFNNRELASFIVFVGFIAFATYKSKGNKDSDLLKSFINVIKAFFVPKILIVTFIFIIYVMFEIGFLYLFVYIDNSLSKETVFWILGAYGLILKNQNITQEKGVFKIVLLDNIKLIILFEYLFNMYTFSLPIEIVIGFIITVVLMMKAILKYEEIENKELTDKVLDYIVNFIGGVIILFTLVSIINDYNNINLVENIKKFLLPLILTFLFVPFYYFLMAYSKSEQLHIGIGLWFRHDEKLAQYAKDKIDYECCFNYNKLDLVHKNLYKFDGAKTKQEIKNILKEILK